MCVTIIGTPRNSYEQNVSIVPISILLFKVDQRV